MLDECRSENKALGLGDIAALLRKLDELRIQDYISDTDFMNIKKALLGDIASSLV